MKKIALAFLVVFLMSFGAWAMTCPITGPYCIWDNTLEVGGTTSQVLANTGTLRLGGTGGTYNNYLDIDFEQNGYIDLSTASNNRMQFTATATPTAAGQQLYKFGGTISDSAYGATWGTYFYLINNDVDGAGSTYNLYSVYNTGAVAHANSNLYGGQINIVEIDGANASTITQTVATNSTLKWYQTTADADLTVTYGAVNQAVIQQGAPGSGTMDLTFTNLDMYATAKGGSSGNIGVSDSGNGILAGFHAANLGLAGTVDNQVGLYVDDLTTGTNKYGVLLDDGADCVWFDGTSGTALCSETVTISSANLLDATPTPITMIAGRTGTILEFVGATLMYDAGATAYVCGADDEMVFEYETTGSDVSAEWETDGFLEGGDAILMIPAKVNPTIPIAADLAANIGKGIMLYQTNADCTDGNGVVRAHITYKVHVTGF